MGAILALCFLPLLIEAMAFVFVILLSPIFILIGIAESLHKNTGRIVAGLVIVGFIVAIIASNSNKTPNSSPSTMSSSSVSKPTIQYGSTPITKIPQLEDYNGDTPRWLADYRKRSTASSHNSSPITKMPRITDYNGNTEKWYADYKKWRETPKYNFSNPWVGFNRQSESTTRNWLNDNSSNPRVGFNRQSESTTRNWLNSQFGNYPRPKTSD